MNMVKRAYDAVKAVTSRLMLQSCDPPTCSKTGLYEHLRLKEFLTTWVPGEVVGNFRKLVHLFAGRRVRTPRGASFSSQSPRQRLLSCSIKDCVGRPVSLRLCKFTAKHSQTLEGSAKFGWSEACWRPPVVLTFKLLKIETTGALWYQMDRVRSRA